MYIYDTNLTVIIIVIGLQNHSSNVATFMRLRCAQIGSKVIDTPQGPNHKQVENTPRGPICGYFCFGSNLVSVLCYQILGTT